MQQNVVKTLHDHGDALTIVCLCLKFMVASIYDLPGVVDCLFQVFAAARLEAVLLLPPEFTVR